MSAKVKDFDGVGLLGETLRSAVGSTTTYAYELEGRYVSNVETPWDEIPVALLVLPRRNGSKFYSKYRSLPLIEWYRKATGFKGLCMELSINLAINMQCFFDQEAEIGESLFKLFEELVIYFDYKMYCLRGKGTDVRSNVGTNVGTYVDTYVRAYAPTYTYHRARLGLNAEFKHYFYKSVKRLLKSARRTPDYTYCAQHVSALDPKCENCRMAKARRNQHLVLEMPVRLDPLVQPELVVPAGYGLPRTPIARTLKFILDTLGGDEAVTFGKEEVTVDHSKLMEILRDLDVDSVYNNASRENAEYIFHVATKLEAPYTVAAIRKRLEHEFTSKKVVMPIQRRRNINKGRVTYREVDLEGIGAAKTVKGTLYVRLDKKSVYGYQPYEAWLEYAQDEELRDVVAKIVEFKADVDRRTFKVVAREYKVKALLDKGGRIRTVWQFSEMKILEEFANNRSAGIVPTIERLSLEASLPGRSWQMIMKKLQELTEEKLRTGALLGWKGYWNSGYRVSNNPRVKKRWSKLKII